jgi:hypothetical protein
MDKDEISPLAIAITFVLHFGLLYLALNRLPHHHPHHSPYDVIHVSIPVSTPIQPRPNEHVDIHDLIVPDQTLVNTTENLQPVEQDRYYLPQELSQQVRVVVDDTARLNVPIRQVVTMTLYINESGGIDDVTIDNAGVLTEDEKEQLINGFKNMLFLPGMRGEKIVKSQFRIELQINRRVIFHR